jgi:hypothetical protein
MVMRHRWYASSCTAARRSCARDLAAASGSYPILSEWMAHPRIESPTGQFELSLDFLLDGIAAQLRRRKRENP